MRERKGEKVRERREKREDMPLVFRACRLHTNIDASLWKIATGFRRNKKTFLELKHHTSRPYTPKCLLITTTIFNGIYPFLEALLLRKAAQTPSPTGKHSESLHH